MSSNRAGPVPCRAVTDGGEVDDDGDVLVAVPGVLPHVLIDSQDGDTVEACRIVDEPSVSLGQDGVVRWLSRHPQPAAIRDTLRWSTTRPRSAHANPPRETFARGSAATDVSCDQKCAHAVHRGQRTRTGSVVCRVPSAEGRVREPARHGA